VDRRQQAACEIRFGRYLRRHRERLHLTLDAVESLSAAVGQRISKSNLSRMENCQVSPNLSKLGTLSLLYDVPLGEMVDRYEIGRRLQRVELPEDDGSLGRALELAYARIRSGNYLEALALARRCRERLGSGNGSRATRRSDRRFRRLYLIEVQCLLHLGFHECARTDAERVLALDDLDMEERLLAWHAFVASSIWLEKLQVAEASLAYVEEILRSPDAPARFAADFALLRGNLCTSAARHGAALEAYSRAMRSFDELSRPLEVCRSRVLCGGALIELGKPRTARAQLQKALTEARRGGYGRLECLALSNLVKLAWGAGRMEEAENHARRSNRIARQLSFEPVLFRNAWYQRRIALARGDAARARGLERTLLLHLEKLPGMIPEVRCFREELRQRREGAAS
jgi:tetratricopeptide (TPR) repeat protein